MNFPEVLKGAGSVFLEDREGRLALPHWARAMIWLGWWCRRHQLNGSRLLVAAVLPSREFAAAFAGLGCLLAGAATFQSGLNWERFRNLPAGSEVFWRTHTDKTRYGGRLVEMQDSNADLVPVSITVGRKKDIGVTWYFSPARFGECIFSEEALPTERRTAAMEKALRIYRELGVKPSLRWIWSAGPETWIVTNQANFWRQTQGLRIGTSGSPAVAFDEALCAESHLDRTVAKLRLVSPSGVTDHEAPLFILDGDAAWGLFERLHGGNVLVVLDRGEYTPEMHDFLLEARSFAIDPKPEVVSEIPEHFPPEVEIAGFVLPSN